MNHYLIGIILSLLNVKLIPAAPTVGTITTTNTPTPTPTFTLSYHYIKPTPSNSASFSLLLHPLLLFLFLLLLASPTTITIGSYIPVRYIHICARILKKMTDLLDTLTQELNQFTTAGQQSLNSLIDSTDTFLQQLRDMEAELACELEIETKENHNAVNLQNEQDSDDTFHFQQINSIHRGKFNVKLLQGQQEVWYKSSIDKLKSYNSANNKFQKNVLNNSKFLIDINEAYSYPLNIDSHPVCPFDLENEINEEMSSFSSRSTFPLSSSSTYPLSAPLPAHIEANFEKQEGTEELTKAIILHLLKSGYSDVVPLLVNQVSPLLSTTYRIDFELSQQFTLLHEILDDICLRHDLRQALGWFYTKYNENMEKNPSFVDSVDAETFSSTEFKFHMLQFILLLNGKQLEFSSQDAIEAYIYSKEHFERFLKKYLHEMAPLLTLMLFNEDDDSGIENFSKLRNKGLAARDFIEKMRIGFLIDKGSHRGNANTSQLEFVSLLLDCFTNVHEHQSLFTKLAMTLFPSIVKA